MINIKFINVDVAKLERQLSDKIILDTTLNNQEIKNLEIFISISAPISEF